MSNTTKFAILGLLAEHPLTGYELKRLVDLRFRFFWQESYGQIYPELEALARDGFVTAGTDEGPRGRRRFDITAAGRDLLAGWLSEPAEKETVRLEILLKMYFAKWSDRGLLQQDIVRFGTRHAADLDLLRRFRTELEAIPDPDGNHGDILRVIDFGIRANEAYVAWAEATATYLKGGIPA